VICLKPRPAGLGSYRAPLQGSKRYGRLLKAGLDCGTLALAILSLLGAPRLASPQCSNPPCASGTPLEGWTFVDWQIYGIVTTLNGDPVGGVRVRVDPNAGMQKVTTVLTDLRGEYHTHVELDGALYPTLTVNVSASKPGYDDARESAEFKKTGEVREIDLILATKKKNPDKLPPADLVSRLAPRFSNPAVLTTAKGSARKDYARGVDELVAQGDAVKAISTLSKALKREPDCTECEMMLGLAQLSGASLYSFIRRFDEIAKNQEKKPLTAQRPEPLLVLGVAETWKDQEKQAEALLSQALRISPNDPLVLEELGRAFLLDQQPEVAEGYLGRAVKAGSLPDARLLHARALAEEGDVGTAESAMKSYLAGRDVRDMPEDVRRVYGELQDRRQLESYGRAKSVLDQPLPALVKAFPELHGIDPAANEDSAASILRAVGQNVQAQFQNFADTASLERIEQQMLRARGRVAGSLDQKFQYLMLADSQKAGVRVQEYRTNFRGDRVDLEGLADGFMITSGFASADVIFHPIYQSEADFRYLGREDMNGRLAFVIAFAQKPKTARIFERFNSGNASVLILVQGLAWIDSETNRILRLRTDLLEPAREIHLNSQTTEIDYGEVRFGGTPASFWLPRRVVVTIEWRGKSFRNVHEYSDFRLFNVHTDEKRKPAETAPVSERDAVLNSPSGTW
jgi:tetratricopeptide (TPR) repeat protein